MYFYITIRNGALIRTIQVETNSPSTAMLETIRYADSQGMKDSVLVDWLKSDTTKYCDAAI